MPNTQALPTSMKVNALDAVMPTGATIRAALYLASATVNASTTAYTATGEVSGSGYTARGVVVTHAVAATSSGTTAFVTPSASIVYTSVTLSTAFDCVMLFNETTSDRAICVNTFGSQTVTAGNFTLTMPANNASNALIRLA